MGGLSSIGGVLGNVVGGVLGMIGIGPDSASAIAAKQGLQNAAQQQLLAEEENIRSRTNLMEQDQANRATEGGQRAAIGGSGVAIGTGSPLDAQYATYAQDQFKDQVAVFNGQVNVAADQAAAIAAQTQGQAAAAGAQASAISNDAGIAMSIYSIGSKLGWFA